MRPPNYSSRRNAAAERTGRSPALSPSKLHNNAYRFFFTSFINYSQLHQGKAVGADLDGTKIEIARREAAELGIANVEYRLLGIREHLPALAFDLVYARFLLTHLPDPANAVKAFYAALKPGGLLIVEDVDASGCFVFPESKAFWRFHGTLLHGDAKARR
ncbi:MAG: class I SAM-dependent methyltransferase [Acidobacteriota bacterium]|nr:class I SAM-dependent methyltransferase [Acidobacteriota bacterium]